MATSLDAIKSHPILVDHNRIDLTWERAQEQALQAFGAGHAAAARAHWRRALDIAERHFERGDPRLAASLSNHAFALLRQNQMHQANIYFRRAVDAWEDSWRWVPWMSAAKGPEPAPFERTAQDAFYDLIRQGRMNTEELWREQRLPDAHGDDWRSVKPRVMNDVRRLLAAVFLMPTAGKR
jgi:hypothetical protein